MREIVMPQLALGADEVIAQEWLVAPGETFAESQPLLEIETDKAQMEVEAPFAGTLVERLCEPGDTVAVGAAIAYAAEAGEDAEAARAQLAVPTPAAAPAAAPAPLPAAAAPAPGGAEPSTNGAVVRFATVEDGDLAGLRLEPVTRAPAAPAVSAPSTLDDPTAAGPYDRGALSRRRLAIARRMGAATGIPVFSVHRDVLADRGLRAVELARETGDRVTFTDVLLRAVAAAAQAEPRANAWIEGDELLRFERVGVALAVDTPEGVVAPVVRAVESLSLAELAATRADLVARARSGALDARELTGATITLSNVAGLGAHGIMPVLTAPQVVALGVGSARPAAGGRAVTVTLVGDHRALDGADGARFLAALAAALETIP